MADISNSICHVRMITFGYGQRTVFDKASITLRPGVLYGLLGPNGAGKTTLLDLLFKSTKPKSGSVDWTLPPEDRFHVRQYIDIPREFRIGEFIELLFRINMGSFNKKSFLADLPPEWRERMALISDRKTPETSFGERKWATMAAALSFKQSIIALDEPSAGMDVPTRRAMWKRLQALTRAGTTVIVSSHQLQEFEDAVDIILAIKNKQIHQFSGIKGFVETVAPHSNTLDDAFMTYFNFDDVDS